MKSVEKYHLSYWALLVIMQLIVRIKIAPFLSLLE